MNTEIYYHSALTERELEEIQTLREKGAARGIEYKLDPGMDSGILCRRNGAITGFMTVDCFGGEEMESAALADSLTDWEGMSAVLKDCAREKNAQTILFICDPNDRLIREKLESMGLALSFSEYRMVFDRASFEPAPAGGVSLRPAVQADAAFIHEMDTASFGGEGEAPAEHIADTRVILLEGKPAGKLRVNEADGMHGIYGVVVDSSLRGKGIGYQALTLLLRELTESGAANIYLEVDSQNPAAFHLYKKLGFRVKSTFGYYPYSC